MNKKPFLLAVVLLGLIPAACHKKPETTATSGVSETKLRAAYGFAAMTPRDMEGFAAAYDLKKLWHDFVNGKTGVALRANPLFQQAAGSAQLLDAFGKISANQEAVAWKKILGDAFGDEAFMIFAPGTSERLQALQRFSNEARVNQLKVALAQYQAGSKKQPEVFENYFEAYRSLGKSLEIPPLIVGGKLSVQKAALVAELERAEKNLPPGVEVSAFNLNGNLPFKSAVFSVSKLLPPAQQEQFKKELSAKTSDQKLADEVFQSLMARKLEVAYGFIGDYFVASIGPDHAHLKICGNFQDSLLARPEMAPCAQFADKPLLMLSWADATLAAASIPHYEITPWFERFKTDIEGVMSADDVSKLETDLRRIDSKAGQIFQKNASPMVGVAYRDHGVRSEVFGGMQFKALSNAKPLKFSGVPTASTLFWMDVQRDPAVSAATWAWLEDITNTGYDLFLRFGLPKLPDQQRLGFAMMQNLAVPKLVELYHITRDEFAKSLGSERALAVDLGGEMPAVPMIPQPVLEQGKMLRLAWISDVKDRGLLDQSWNNYLKLARDAALMIPQTSSIPGGRPAPQSETRDGVTLSYYPLPIPTGDLLPNVGVTRDVMVMSTSLKYSVDAAKAASVQDPAQKPMALDLRINLKAAYDFLNKWIALAGEHPEMVFPGKPDKAVEFQKNQQGIVALLKSLHALGGFEYRIFEENGQCRISSKIDWQE